MQWSRGITIGILLLSLAANGWLGFYVYQSSKIPQMETASYDSFKTFLGQAMKATDVLKSDKPGSKDLTVDTRQANSYLERAVGTIWGMRTDFAKKGMDIFPIYDALMRSENFSPDDPDFASRETQSFIDKNSRTLHDLYLTLAPTSFTEAGLHRLKRAVSSFYEKYDGYPSYSKLQ